MQTMPDMYGYQPGIGDIPPQSDLAAMGYSGNPSDMANDYAADNPGETGFDSFSSSTGPANRPLGDIGSGGLGASGFGSPGGSGSGAGGASGLPGPLGSLFGGGGGLGNIGGTGGGLGPGGFGLGGGSDTGGGFAPVGTPDTAGGSDSSQGAAVYLTDPKVVASEAGVSVQKGAEQLGGSIKGAGEQVDTTLNTDTGQLTDEATKVANLGAQVLQNPDTGLLPRIGVGLAAIVLIAMGLWMLGKEHGAIA
jgi:hypothetical protein